MTERVENLSEAQRLKSFCEELTAISNKYGIAPEQTILNILNIDQIVSPYGTFADGHWYLEYPRVTTHSQHMFVGEGI